MTRWAFLGAGSMGSAMVHGLIARRICGPNYIACMSGTGRTAEALAHATGITMASTAEDLLAGSDVLILACKPQNLASLDPALPALTEGKLVISILAGKRLSTLRKVFPAARNHVRIMPNTPGQIGAGMSGWCAAQLLDEDDRSTLLALLQALGKSVEVDESAMNAVTAIAGSGPAYVFEFVAAFREAAIAAGLSHDVAALMVQETVLGSARLLAETGGSPDALRDRVTSPNGTTAAALRVIDDAGLRRTLREAVAAAARRAAELSAES